MIQRLSSIRLTFYALGVLVSLLAWGTGLSFGHKDAFTALNHETFLAWLGPAWQSSPLVVIWFSILCLTAGVVLINGVCCCFVRQLASALKTGAPRKWLFFILHCLFLVVLACHGLALGLSQKQSSVTLFPGQVQEFEGYTLRVADVVFADDLSLLKLNQKEQRAMMTRENIRLNHNWADLVLEKEGSQAAVHKAFMLSPLRHGFYQVTLTQFTIDPEKGIPGVTLNFTLNYFNLIFFVGYAVMILAMAGFTAVTWKTSSDKKEAL